MGIRIVWSLLGLAAALSGCSDSEATPRGKARAAPPRALEAWAAAPAPQEIPRGRSRHGDRRCQRRSGGQRRNHNQRGSRRKQGGSAAIGGASGSGAGGTTSNFQPYFFDDFESYGDGASLSNNQPFDAAGRSTASSEVAFRGAQSARMEIRSWGRWRVREMGRDHPIKPALKQGQEVWVRLQVRWPQSFQFSASPWMKFLRLHSTKADGGNAGYNDLYVDQADSTQSVLRTIKEVHDVWAVYDGPKLPRDRWESYEMYLFIDDQAVDDGGAGRVRIWRDDTLIFDRTDVPTIVEAAGTIDYFYLFTYWNNEQPPDNHCFVDDLVIATDASPPPNHDSAGHAFIGPWTP
ncbi:MAG: hypothetical protein R3B07_04195 [Polyangiaceae bacterium]